MVSSLLKPYTATGQPATSPYGTVPQTPVVPKPVNTGESWYHSMAPVTAAKAPTQSYGDGWGKTYGGGSLGSYQGTGGATAAPNNTGPNGQSVNNTPYNTSTNQDVYNPWKSFGTTTNDFLPWLHQQLGFGQGLEGQRETGIQNFINSYTPGNMAAQVDAFGRGADSRAQQQARQMAPVLAGQGLGSGATGGAQLDALNTAAGSTNHFAQMLYSPEGQQQIMQSIQQAIAGGQNPSSLQSLLAMMNAVQGGQSAANNFSLGQQQINNSQSQGLFGGLGGILGSILPLLIPGAGGAAAGAITGLAGGGGGNGGFGRTAYGGGY